MTEWPGPLTLLRFVFHPADGGRPSNWLTDLDGYTVEDRAEDDDPTWVPRDGAWYWCGMDFTPDDEPGSLTVEEIVV